MRIPRGSCWSTALRLYSSTCWALPGKPTADQRLALDAFLANPHFPRQVAGFRVLMFPFGRAPPGRSETESKKAPLASALAASGRETWFSHRGKLNVFFPFVELALLAMATVLSTGGMAPDTGFERKRIVPSRSNGPRVHRRDDPRAGHAFSCCSKVAVCRGPLPGRAAPIRQPGDSLGLLFCKKKRKDSSKKSWVFGLRCRQIRRKVTPKARV